MKSSFQVLSNCTWHKLPYNTYRTTAITTYSNGRACKKEIPHKNSIITNTDKGGAVVIMDTDSYIKESNCQLSDKPNYSYITEDPILKHYRVVKQTIQRFKNEKLLPKKLQTV